MTRDETTARVWSVANFVKLLPLLLTVALLAVVPAVGLGQEPVTVQFDPTEYNIDEVQAGLHISVTLSATVSSSTTVELSTSDVEAEAGSDYEPVNTTVTFPAFSTSRTVEVTLIDDFQVEAYEETFSVSLSSPSAGISLGTNYEATITIQDNDEATVGFRSSYRIRTDGGSPFELHLLELDPNVDCVIQVPFSVRISYNDPQGVLSPPPTNPIELTFEACAKEHIAQMPIADIVPRSASVIFTLSEVFSGPVDGNGESRVKIPIGRNLLYLEIIDQTDPFAREPSGDFDGLGITDPEGIWSDGRTMWVSSPANDAIRAYDMTTKQRDESKELSSLATQNGDPQAIWSDGKTMWIGDGTYRGNDGTFGWVFAYKMDINSEGSVGPDHGARESAKEFDPSGGSSPRGIWSDGRTMLISQSVDGLTGDIRAYQLDINSDGSVGANHGTREPGKDFESVVAEGLWSNGRIVWAANGPDRKIHAYNLDSMGRNDDLDFALGSGPSGIWSDEETMWVVSSGGLLAYQMPIFVVPSRPTQSVVSNPEVADPPDPPKPDKIEVEICVAEVKAANGAEEATGAITLGGTITGKWEAGCPSITRGGRLAKYYTLTMPITSGVKIELDSHLDTYLVLRSGGLSGNIIAEDDDDGPGNNSLIEQTLPAGDYTIEATTFYSDGVEAEFTLKVTSAPTVLYDGPVSAVAHRGYAPAGPTMTVRLLPTLPRGSLEITIEDADGLGEGAGPLGGAQTTDASAGTVLIALPRSVWLVYDELSVEVRESGSWSTHSQSEEEALLAEEATGGDFSWTLEQVPGLIENAEDASGLIASLNTLMSAASVPAATPDFSALDDIFTESHANCVSQVVVPWLTEATETTGVRVSLPVENLAGSYLSVAASFVAGGGEQGLAQLHDLLDTGEAVQSCQRPEQSEE